MPGVDAGGVTMPSLEQLSHMMAAAMAQALQQQQQQQQQQQPRPAPDRA